MNRVVDLVAALVVAVTLPGVLVGVLSSGCVLPAHAAHVVAPGVIVLLTLDVVASLRLLWVAARNWAG